MKKIVALVLSLALVLALGTVAFADTKTNTFKGNVLDAANGNQALFTEGNVDVKKTTTTEVKTTSGSTTTTTYTADKYEVGNVTYAAVSADASYTHKIVDKDGKLVATVIVANELTTSKVITKTGVGTGKTGDYAKDAEYVVIGGKAYAVGGQNWAINSKNEFVDYGNALDVIQPTVVKAETKVNGYVIYNTSGSLIAIKDDDGKQYDVFTSTDKAPANYTGEFGRVEVDGHAYVFMLGAPAAAETPAASGVTSAKTFDAGVAMYAGLALMSVAGSAVVIGKKKEF